MTVESSETQDIVEKATTENNSDDSQENQEEQQQEQETQETETETHEQEKPKKSRAQERIEQTTRENAELRQKLAEFKAQKNAPKPLEKPKVEDFESWSEFEDAQEEWRINEAMRRMEEKQGKSTQDKAQIDSQIAFDSAVAELESEGVDVNKYIERANELPPLPIQLDQFGLSAKDTLKLAADLLDDEEVFISLSRMNPVQAAAKIGQIIESGKTKKPPTVSKAPKPITPVQANAATTRDPSKMSDDEWYRSEKDKRKGK
ncbi:hypothetical protein [Acinetobacter sp. Ac_5812]|uniref:hypothetical protein n=1 Tax=Acinetobacter sp. Ac_5812 TaxID=1848937 RepID=UPI00148F5738|nr:hypothetical protein [Acinetobacter sp. Ac_5812]NNP70937.1 hypothetical protein [Acinetobacter sp. Ac_5812]